MRNFLILCLLLLFISCEKEESSVETVANLKDEIKEGAWIIDRIEDSTANILINGKGAPEIILFFEEDSIIKGRLFGSYAVSNDSLNMKLQIDTVKPIFFDKIDVLGNYPSRYYDIEAVFKEEVQGKAVFYENGWESQISFHFEDGKVMWMIRY